MRLWAGLDPPVEYLYGSKAVLLLLIICVVSVLFYCAFVCVCLFMPFGYLLGKADLLALVCNV